MTLIFSRPRKHLLPMLLAFFLISLFGCFKKKNSNPTNLQEWLEIQWPGRFEVVSTPTNFTDKEYYYGKRKSVVAEKDDRDIQFIVHWVKDEQNMGLTTEVIESSARQSRENVLHARDLVKQLNAAGLQNVSVGANPEYTDIFLFAEPIPEERLRVLEVILDVMHKTSGPGRFPCDIVFMEPKIYGTEFKDVIPAGHWARIDSWQHANQIIKLSIPSEATADPKHFTKQWQFNTLSDRMLEYVRKAHPIAVRWADKNLASGITVEEMQGVAFGLDEKNGLIVEIDFPYFESTGDTTSNTGMITGYYDIDAGTFTRLKNILSKEEE